MSASTLSPLYICRCDDDDNNNNNINSYDDDDKCKKELPQNQIRKKLLTKLGKINISKSNTRVDTEIDTMQNNESQPQPHPQPQPQEPSRNKSTEYYYRHRDEKLEYQKHYNRQKGDAIKDYNKSYYVKRREEILEKARTKITCECGCVVQLFNMNSHKKTKKHVRYLEMRTAMMSAVMVTRTTTSTD